MEQEVILVKPKEERVTVCSYCGKLVNTEGLKPEDKYVIHCSRYTPVGNKPKGQFDIEQMKGGTTDDMVNKKAKKSKSVKAKKMTEDETAVTEETVADATEEVAPAKKAKAPKEKKEFGKTLYVKCSKCGKEKFARQEIYDQRVKKFGSVEKMLAGYVCRDCKREAKRED